MDGSFSLAKAAPRSAVKAKAQHTFAHAASCLGVGVHAGLPARLTLLPAAPNSGITFVRSDLTENNRIPASFDLVTDTRMCTVLTNKAGVSIATVEHIMAALAGCGVDNAEVHVDGPELPIMDGSAAPFVRLIEQAGLVAQDVVRKRIRILRDVRVEDGDKWATLSPSDAVSYGFTINFASKAIGQQQRDFVLDEGSFADELSGARTFGFLHEVEQMRKLGLGRGGSLENAVVIDGETIMNKDGLRYTDEFVRHKLLDSVGDLALAGAPLLANFRAYKSGHTLNNKLLHSLFADAGNWEWV